MSYIGNTNTTQAFTPAIDYFSGTGSATAFTLSKPVASVAQVQVVVNNVAQNPSSAYSVSSNTITFTSAPSSGTNNIYVYYTSPITQLIAPSQGTVTASSMASSTGTGAGVFQTSPTLVTPALGTPSALVLTNATGLPASQLTGTQTIPRGTLPTGSVLQVVQASYSTSTTNATSTYADTGLTASITPSSSSSKILVTVAQQGVAKVNSDTKINIKLFRGATDLTVLANAGATNSSAVILIGSATIVYLDSPATTSATTYKTQFNSNNNTSYVGVQDSNTPSTITLMEISA